jgi:MFS family permease
LGQPQDRHPGIVGRNGRRSRDLVRGTYALFFLTQTLKVPAVNAEIMIAVGLLLGTPFFIIFGWLSDKIGRKPIILAGFALGVITYFPIFQGITHFANPKLETDLPARR